jgi:hypothetical protein
VRHHFLFMIYEKTDYWFKWLNEVDPIGGTTGTGFLVGSAAAPIC